MDIIQPLDLEAGYRTFSFKDKHHLVLSLKLYFPLQGGDPILFSEAYQKMAALPSPFIDEGLPKLTPEFSVVGSAMAPNGKAVTSLEVTASIMDQTKKLRAIGDRYWVGGISGATQPIPYTEMPITWDRAFGGKKHKSNPLGKGIDKVATPLGEPMVALPNIELPNQLMTGLNQSPSPAGFMPLGLDHPQRSQYLGTYDDHWLANAFPGYPDDFNLRAFNVAPEDQLIKGDLKSSCSYSFTHMHDQFPTIEGVLPAIRARAFLVKKGLEVGDISVNDMREVTTELDTVVFFPNQLMGMMIYRGTITTSDADSSEYKHLLCAYENTTMAPRPREHYHMSLIGRIHPDLNMQFALTTKDLIPDDVPCGMARLTQQEVEPRQLFAEHMQAKLDETLAESKVATEQQIQASIAKLKAEGKDTSALEAKLNNPPEDVWQKRYKDLIEKLAPGSTSPEGKVDLQKIDFRAFDDLAKLSEEHAEFQKQQVKEQLKEQIQKANGNPKSEAVLQKALLRLELPPLLPRLPDPQITIDQINQSAHQIEQSNKVAAEKGLPVQPKPNIQELTKKVLESHKMSQSSYRMAAHMSETGTPPLAEERDSVMQFVNERLENHQDLTHLDLAGLDFSNRHLKGVDFTGSYLEQCDFRNADLEDCNFTDAILARSNMIGVNLKGANLTRSNLGDCQLQHADLSDAILTECEIARSNFTEANLTNVDLTETLNLLEITFKKSNLTGVKFSEPTFLEIDFSYAVLKNTQLESATFNECSIVHAQFDSVSMEGTNFIASDCSFAHFLNADMTNCRFLSETKLCEAKFDRVDAEDCCFRSADMSRAVFRNSHLNNSDFGDANARYASFDGCQLKGAQCMNTDFTFADLSNANFYEASLMQATLTEAKLRRSNFYGAEFMGATVGKTDFSGANLENTKLADWRPSKWQ